MLFSFFFFLSPSHGSILSDDAEPLSQLLNMQVNICMDAKKKKTLFLKTLLKLYFALRALNVN